MKDYTNDLLAINTFWFKDISEKDWWVKNPEFDQHVADRFLKLHTIASQEGFSQLAKTPELYLAEIILLDQFSRNMFRDKPQSFASDPQALTLAKKAVSLGEDQKLPVKMRQFVYMPYMHSESIDVHDEAVVLFESLGLEQSLKFEHAHRSIVARFGRYPHRNHILGRESTAEELEFLQQEGSSF